MESGKRSKNFTEREKMLLIKVAKEFVHIIDNKRTDGTSVEAKKQAWMALSNKYNAASETGFRTGKQLHALYDNLKKTARKNMSDDKLKMYKTEGGKFCPKTTAIDKKVVALLTPQLKPLSNEFESSTPYYNLNPKTQVLILKRKNQKQMNEDAITSKTLEILEIQRQQEVIKLEKTKILLDIDIELKGILLENAKMDLEYKKKNLNNL